MGYVGDQSAIDTLSFYNTMTSVAGLATLAMPLATSFPALAVLNAFYGFFISANFALTTVILVELVGVERLTDAYGIVSLAQGVANLVGPPLAGNLQLSYLPVYPSHRLSLLCTAREHVTGGHVLTRSAPIAPSGDRRKLSRVN